MPVPEPPDSLINTANNVMRWWSDPCDAPVTVWASTFVDVFFPLLIEYHAIDLKQVFTAYFRPAKYIWQNRNRRKGGGGRKSNDPKPRGSWKRIFDFDLNNEIGKRLPGAKVVRARQVSSALGTLWIFEGLIERLLYWLMLIDMVKRFVYYFTTMLYKTEYCKATCDMILDATGTPQGTIPPAGFTTIFANDVQKQRGPVSWTGGALSIPQGFGILCCSAVIGWQPPLPKPAYTSVIFEVNGSEFTTLAIESFDIEEGQVRELGLSCNVRPNRVYVWAHTSDAGFCEAGQIRVDFFGRTE